MADRRALSRSERRHLEESLNMPYVTSVERIAEARGEARGKTEGVKCLAGTTRPDLRFVARGIRGASPGSALRVAQGTRPSRVRHPLASGSPVVARRSRRIGWLAASGHAAQPRLIGDRLNDRHHALSENAGKLRRILREEIADIYSNRFTLLAASEDAVRSQGHRSQQARWLRIPARAVEGLVHVVDEVDFVELLPVDTPFVQVANSIG
jgi:hypothetical protein